MRKLDLKDYFLDYNQPMNEQKYFKIQSTANPFSNNEILYKGVLKYKRNYLFCQVIFNFDEEIMEKYFQKIVVNNNSRFILKFHGVTPKNNNIWESQIELSFKTFVRWFLGCESNDFSYQKFRDNLGFNKYQLDQIRKNLDKLIYFDNSEAKVLFFQQHVFEQNIQKKKQKNIFNKNQSYVAQQNLFYAAAFDSSLNGLMEIIKMENSEVDLRTNLSIMKSSTFISDKRSMRLFKRIQKIKQNANIEFITKLQSSKKKIQKSLVERKVVVLSEQFELAARDNMIRYQEHQFQSDISYNKYFKILRGYNSIYTHLDQKMLIETKDYNFKIQIYEKIISDRLELIQEERVQMFVTSKTPLKQSKRLYFEIYDPYIMDKSELNDEEYKYMQNFLLNKLLMKTRSIHGIKERVLSFYKNSLIEDALYSAFIDIFNQKTVELLLYYTYNNASSIDYSLKENQDIMRELTNHLNITFINQHLNEITENLKRVYFESIKTQFFFRIQNEKFIVESTAHRTRICLNIIPLCYIILQIFPITKQKTVSYKFILNLSDIEAIFKSKLNHDTIFNSQSLLQISQYVMKKIQKIPFDHYSRFILPLRAFYPFNIHLKKLILINQFSVERNDQIDNKFNLSPLSSMRLEMNYMKVIYKGVSKVQGQYCILTIKQYQYLDYYQISIYFPISARKYSTFIYEQNIRQFTENFMHGILKYPTEVNSQKYRCYKDFEDSINNEQFNIQREEDELIEPKAFCLLVNPNLQKDNLLLYYIWNRIAERIQVRKNLQNIQIFELDNYNSVLHEQIFDRVIRVHNNDSILFEVFLENQNKKQIHRISDPFRNIDYVNTSQYMLFIKINFFNRINQYNEKINLQNTLYTYYTENLEILLEDLKLLQKKKRQNLKYLIANQENAQNSENVNINKPDFEDIILEKQNDNVFILFKGNHSNSKDRFSIDEILNSLEITQSKIFDAIIYISEKIQSNYQILFMQEHSTTTLKKSTQFIQSLFSKSFISLSKIAPSNNKLVNLARQLKYKNSLIPENEQSSINNSIQLQNQPETPITNFYSQQLINPHSSQMQTSQQGQILPQSTSQKKVLKVNFHNSISPQSAAVGERKNPILYKSLMSPQNTKIGHQVSIPLVYTLQTGGIQGQQSNQSSLLNINFAGGNASENNISAISQKLNNSIDDQENINQPTQKASILSKMVQTKRNLAININQNQVIQPQVFQNNNNINVTEQDDNSQIYSNNLKVIETNIIKRDKRYRANIKTNSNLNMGIVENTLAKNYIILYRKLLTFKPLTFLSIIYSERSKNIIFSTQNLMNCKDVNKKYSLNQIEYIIPYATKMIQNSLFQEIGERLYLAYKNRIIVTVQQELNE